MYKNHNLHWFAIRTTYCREFLLKKQLEEKEIQTFIPMRYELIITDEQQKYVEVPAIHNLIFIRSTRLFLDEYQARRDGVPMYYMFDSVTKQPVVVRDSDMDAFIRVTQLCNKNLLYLKDNIEKFNSNPKVRVMDGQFAGAEGYVVRIRRDRKVVLVLDGIIAVAISGIHHSLLQIIE